MRNIKKVLRMNGLDERLYASWSRYSKKFDWKKRVEEYDTYVDTMRQKIAAQEENERREAYKKMLTKVTKVVDEKLDRISADDLTVNQTMDFLERTYELGSKVSGVSGEKDDGCVPGQLEINFVDSFDGV